MKTIKFLIITILISISTLVYAGANVNIDRSQGFTFPEGQIPIGFRCDISDDCFTSNCNGGFCSAVINGGSCKIKTPEPKYGNDNVCSVGYSCINSICIEKGATTDNITVKNPPAVTKTGITVTEPKKTTIETNIPVIQPITQSTVSIKEKMKLEIQVKAIIKNIPNEKLEQVSIKIDNKIIEIQNSKISDSRKKNIIDKLNIINNVIQQKVELNKQIIK